MFGPYTVFRAPDKKKSFCILEDNTISQRSYIKDEIKKVNKVQSKSMATAITELENTLTHLRSTKGYTNEEAKTRLGKRTARPATKSPATKIQKVSADKTKKVAKA